LKTRPKWPKHSKKGWKANTEVAVARTGEDGFFHADAEVFDLIVLDVMLPGRDGIESLSTLRKRGMQSPILILTAKDAFD